MMRIRPYLLVGRTEIRIPINFFYFGPNGIRGVNRVRDFNNEKKGLWKIFNFMLVSATF